MVRRPFIRVSGAEFLATNQPCYHSKNYGVGDCDSKGGEGAAGAAVEGVANGTSDALGVGAAKG